MEVDEESTTQEPDDKKIETTNSSSQSPQKSPKVGKGWKYCKQCKAVIGARAATCPKCKYEYPFKGKTRMKKKGNSERMIIGNPSGNYNHETLNTATIDTTQINENDPLKPDHSTFMKKKPTFVDIEPEQKQQLTSDKIDGYINESQLLLDYAFQQITKYGDLDAASKILNRSLTNLTFLATLCDSNDHHQDKCPNLDGYI